MGMMTFEELLKNRRSVRRYQDRGVPVEIVQEVISDSTLAPSAGNGQPWEFVVVNDRAMIRRLSDESKQNILARIAADPDDYAKRYQGMLQNEDFNVFYNAPCLVLVVGSAGLKNLLVDCALAASYLMLSAAARGLGTCWVNLGAEIHDPALREELGLPDDSTIVAPIIIGYPERIPQAPKRKAPTILRVLT
jgi:nitroreductase